jgi:hypothetical protein
MLRHDLRPRIVASIMATVGLLASASAHATLIGDQVNITFESPNDGIGPLTDNNVTVGAGNEIQTADGSNIGGDGTPGSTPLLSEEFLDIQADRIILQLEAGFDDGNGNLSTGYSPGAYWLIAGLDFAGGTITGFDLFLTGISNFGLSDIVFSSDNTFQIFISSLFIADSDTGFDVGQIELRLRTNGTPPPPPVPEPGTLALLSLGLAGLAGVRRRRPR